MNALLTQQKQTRRSRLPLSQLIPGWVQVALFGWMICWGNHPLPRVHATKVEYVAVGTARIDYSKSSPEQSDGRAERARASQFLELVTTINGVRNWHVTGPDIDGRYGGLNGCGGVEAIYNQSTSSATYLLSDTYGHTEGTFNGTTFVWNPTQCDGYGALPGTTKPSALVAGANVASQLGWRGHYIDPTGFYYMGARNYAPDSGTFLSPDPLGHSASMDLYSYCNGDPVNQYDADGRFGKSAVNYDGFQNVADTYVASSGSWQSGNYLSAVGGYTAATVVGAGLVIDTGLNITGVGEVINAGLDVLKVGVKEAGNLLANQAGKTVVTDVSDTTTVGRWMSEGEYAAMVESGTVQAPLNGAAATHVTVPPNSAAFTPPPQSTIFAEFDVPTSQLNIHDAANGWGRVFGPGSLEARLATSKGLPVPPAMPPATNIRIPTR